MSILSLIVTLLFLHCSVQLYISLSDILGLPHCILYVIVESIGNHDYSFIRFIFLFITYTFLHAGLASLQHYLLYKCSMLTA